MASANIAVLSSFDKKGIDAATSELKKLEKASTEASNSLMAGFKRAGEKMTEVGKSLTMGLTLPIVGLGVVAGKWASQAEESANKVNVVFGDQAATIMAWAKESERAFGLSEGQANDFFGSVGTMLQGFSIDMGAIPEMSKSILTLAADLGSFHNLDTAMVMDMISASFRGEYDSIQRVIPTINAAAVETKALAMTGKVAKDSLTAQEKALATYQLMLEGAGPATGDFARTQDGAANSTRIAMAQVRSAGETIGAIFLPLVSKAAAAVAGWAEKFGNLDKNTQQIILVVAGVAAALGPLLIGVGAVAKAIVAVNVAMTTLAANPVVLAIIAITVAIAALVAGVIYAYNNFEWFRTAVDKTWDAIQAAVSWAWENVIKPIWNAIVWYVQNLLIPYYTKLAEIATVVFEKIAAVVLWAWNNIIKPAWDAISWYIQNILVPYYTTLATIASAVFEKIAENVSWAWNNIIKPAWDAISWYIQNYLIPYFQIMGTVVSTVFGAVSSVIGFVWNNVIRPTFDSIRGAIGGLIGAFYSIRDGISGAFSTVFDIISSPFRAAFNFIARAWNNTVGNLGFSVPDWVPGLGGKGFSIPKIPEFATGGIFDAPMSGGAGLAVLHDGEMILNQQQQARLLNGGVGDVNVYVNQSDANPYDIGRELVWQLRVTR